MAVYHCTYETPIPASFAEPHYFGCGHHSNRNHHGNKPTHGKHEVGARPSLRKLERDGAILPRKRGQRRLYREHSRHAEQVRHGCDDRGLKIRASSDFECNRDLTSIDSTPGVLGPFSTSDYYQLREDCGDSLGNARSIRVAVAYLIFDHRTQLWATVSVYPVAG